MFERFAYLLFLSQNAQLLPSRPMEFVERCRLPFVAAIEQLGCCVLSPSSLLRRDAKIPSNPHRCFCYAPSIAVIPCSTTNKKLQASSLDVCSLTEGDTKVRVK